MGVGSGLGAQLVVGEESSYGGTVTLDHSYEFDSETLVRTPSWMPDDGLDGGLEFPRAARVRPNTLDSAGSVPLSVVTNKMGLLFKHMLGSSATAVQVGSSTAYKQVHQPGSLTGKSLAAQVGRPRTSGTVDPYTYIGGKILQWALSCSTQQLLKLALDLNFRDVGTATGLASYAPVVSAATFTWLDASMKIGGTASTTSGVVSVSGGAAITSLVTGFTLTGANPQNTGRHGLGAGGLKSEPISNAKRTGYSLALDAEYTSKAELYDAFVAAGNQPYQITFTGGAIDGSSFFTIDTIISAGKLKQASPNVSGPDVLPQQATIDVESDGTNAPLQITIISTDTAL